MRHSTNRRGKKVLLCLTLGICLTSCCSSKVKVPQNEIGNLYFTGSPFSEDAAETLSDNFLNMILRSLLPQTIAANSVTPPSTGRTTADAVVEAIHALGSSAPFVIIAGVCIYGVMQYSKLNNSSLDKINEARNSAQKQYQDQIEKLNEQIRKTNREIEEIRGLQLSNFEKVFSLHGTISTSILESQQLTIKLKNELEEQEDALKNKQLILNEKEKEFEEISTKFEEISTEVESITDIASRLSGFITSSITLPLSYTIASLSEKYEGKSSGHIGVYSQKKGKYYFYGIYRINARVGVMHQFLSFLDKSNPHFAERLNSAGGCSAAIDGNDCFQNEWRNLATDLAFAEAQRNFIEETHYKPLIQNLTQGNIALDLSSRSLAIQAVAWSVAVQHGSNSPLFSDSLSYVSNLLDDKEIIERVFEQRMKIEKYFPDIPIYLGSLLRIRYELEKRDAIHMIEKD